MRTVCLHVSDESSRFLSQLQYRADLAWMKGVGWLTEGSLNLEQAKKAGHLVSEVTEPRPLISGRDPAL